MTLRDFVEMLRRRKWVVLLSLVLVPAVAVGLSLQQQKLYQASSRVLLSYQNLANQLTGASGFSVAQQPDRIAQTQAGVARTSAVANLVLAQVPKTGLTAGAFLANSSVAPNPNADFLIFKVQSHNPGLAVKLVNEYATEYTVYRRKLDSAAILRARANLKVALKRLDAQGGGSSQLHSDLVNRDQTLATMEALQTSNASVIQTAGGASQIRPRTRYNAMISVVLGLILGLALAYIWDALDTRVRRAEDIGRYLGNLPLLARLPPPGKRLDSESRLVMLGEPDGMRAEPFRMLRTNLEFAMRNRDIRTVMVTSCSIGEGKSTTIANLAVTLARSGQRVALVDLDLRRPRLHQFFRLNGPGVTDVALGDVRLEDALVRVWTADMLSGPAPHFDLDVSAHDGGRGSLDVLPAGASPPDRGAFFDSRALARVLGLLRDQVDVVLLDTPPVLQVGDAMTLSRKADAIVVVTRLATVRRPMLQELSRLLEMSSARVLGFVATAARADLAYEYGYGYEYEQSAIAAADGDGDGDAARPSSGRSGTWRDERGRDRPARGAGVRWKLGTPPSSRGSSCTTPRPSRSSRERSRSSTAGAAAPSSSGAAG